MGPQGQQPPSQGASQLWGGNEVGPRWPGSTSDQLVPTACHTVGRRGPIHLVQLTSETGVRRGPPPGPSSLSSKTRAPHSPRGGRKVTRSTWHQPGPPWTFPRATWLWGPSGRTQPSLCLIDPFAATRDQTAAPHLPQPLPLPPAALPPPTPDTDPCFCLPTAASPQGGQIKGVWGPRG